MPHEVFKACITACNECAEACDYCEAACLKEREVAKLARCIQLDIDCAELCRLAVSYMSRESEHAETVCELCAVLCEACARECSQHPMKHCQDCAQACRRCAEECRRVGSDRTVPQSAGKTAASASAAGRAVPS
jgi:hypothetical protein